MEVFYRPFLRLALMLRRGRSVYRGGSPRRQTRFGPTESACESGSSAFSESTVLRRNVGIDLGIDFRVSYRVYLRDVSAASLQMSARRPRAACGITVRFPSRNPVDKRDKWSCAATGNRPLRFFSRILAARAAVYR